MTIIEKINTLPARKGSPPRMTPTNPQEQLEQFPSDWRTIDRLVEYAFTLSHVVERPTQIAPPGSRALTPNHDDATENRDAFILDLEFAHIHNPPIGSMHLTLPEDVRDAAMKKAGYCGIH